MKKEINRGIAKYFFTKGLDLDLDNVVCRSHYSGQTYYYKNDLILSVNHGEIELHYVEVVG